MNLEIDNHHLVVGAKLPSLEFNSIGILSQNQCCMNRCCERERERERERENLTVLLIIQNLVYHILCLWVI